MKGFIELCVAILIIGLIIGVLNWDTARNERTQAANQQFDKELLEAKRVTAESRCGEHSIQVVYPLEYSTREPVFVFAGEEVRPSWGRIFQSRNPNALSARTVTFPPGPVSGEPAVLWRPKSDCPVVAITK